MFALLCDVFALLVPLLAGGIEAVVAAKIQVQQREIETSARAHTMKHFSEDAVTAENVAEKSAAAAASNRRTSAAALNVVVLGATAVGRGRRHTEAEAAGAESLEAAPQRLALLSAGGGSATLKARALRLEAVAAAAAAALREERRSGRVFAGRERRVPHANRIVAGAASFASVKCSEIIRTIFFISQSQR